MDAPRIIKRKVNADVLQSLTAAGMHPLLAKIIAGRPIPEHAKGASGVMGGQLADLSSPFLMRDMDKAVARLIQAIQKQEVIAIETDHDCDGQTSHAVMIHALVDILGHPKDKILSFIGHRLQEGYGLSDALCERILAAKPDLVITADNGSSDEPRIARLKAAGIEVIVTDHHSIPEEGIPQSAYAVLNPTRADCDFPDPYIAGCMVAWLLMAATRRRMIEQDLLPKTTASMTDLLDFVAVGTVADCVSLARSLNNRVVVQYGLTRINEFKRSCWQAIRPLLKNSNTGLVTSEDLGFLIGPLLNSDGRLSDALGSVNFLLTETIDQALPLAQLLYAQNEERKRIQKELTREAELMAQKQVLAGRVSLVIDLAEGHAGVHGISASRIKDQFGRPTVIFSPKLNESEETLTGSCRSIDAVHIRDVLQAVHEAYPGLILKFGGHKGAAGLTILHEHLAQFQEAFERAVADHLQSHAVGPVIMSDGLWTDPFDPQLIKALYSLAPFGREFDEPIFELQGIAESVRRFGQNFNHLELILKTADNKRIKGIWFFACDAGDAPIEEGRHVHIAFTFAKQKPGEVYLKFAKQV